MPRFIRPLSVQHGARIEARVSLTPASLVLLRGAGRPVPVASIIVQALFDTGAEVSGIASGLLAPMVQGLLPAGFVAIGWLNPGSLPTTPVYGLDLSIGPAGGRTNFDLKSFRLADIHSLQSLRCEAIFARDILAHGALLYDGQAFTATLSY